MDLSRRVAAASILVLAAFLASPRASAATFWQPLQEPGVNGNGTSLVVSPFDSGTLLVAGDMFGSGSTNDSGGHWVSSTGFLNWSLEDYTWHPTNPQIVWCGSADGPYLSQDGGKTWTSKRNGFPPTNTIGTTGETAVIEKVVFDPNSPSTLLALGGSHRNPFTLQPSFGRVWRSTNGGDSWTLLSSVGSGEYANIITGGFAAGSSSIVYVSTLGGLYKSTDAGATWSVSTNGLPPTTNFLALHPTDPDTLWAATQAAQIYKSTDGAQSWQLSSTGLPAAAPADVTDNTFVVVSASNPQVLYAALSQNSAVYRSDDGGSTWTDIVDWMSLPAKLISGNAYYSPFGSADYLPLVWLAVDPRNADVAYVVASGFIMRTSDGGITWYDITSRPEGSSWRGNGWQGEGAEKIAWNPFSPQQLFAIAADCGTLVRSSDYGWSWLAGAPRPIQTFNGGSDATFSADGTIYVGTLQEGFPPAPNQGILKSSDWGATWTYLTSPPGAPIDDQTAFNPVVVYALPDDSSTVWVGMGGNIYLSHDGGDTWSLVADGIGGIFNFAADPTSPTTFYVGTWNGIYQTTDGMTFTLMADSPKSYSGNSVVVDPINPKVLFVPSTQNALWKFDGSGWSMLWTKPMVSALAVDPHDDQRLAVSTIDWPSHDVSIADGVWISDNGGLSWTQVAAGLQNLEGTTIGFNPDESSQLIVGLAGGGFFATDVGRSTPFDGQALSVPGLMQAENYDLGGEAVAYGAGGAHGTSGYRSDDVGICAGGTGYAVCNLTAGEWLKYQVDIAAGTYDITLSASAPAAGSVLHIEVNGVNVTGPITIPAQDAGAYSSVVVPGILLAAGTQYLKVHVDGSGANLDTIQIGAGASLPDGGAPVAAQADGGGPLGSLDSGGGIGTGAMDSPAAEDASAGCGCRMPARSSRFDWPLLAALAPFLWRRRRATRAADAGREGLD